MVAICDKWQLSFGTPYNETRRGELEDLPLDTDLEVLHATIELLGYERFLKAAKAKLMHEDGFGRLHRIQFFDMEPLLLVEVVNSTPEPNGTVKHNL